jgi:hypothetical protein
MSDPVTEKIGAQVAKLLKLAEKNPNENEAAAAAAKAQELITKFNLDVTALEQAGQGSGAREKAAVKGGLYVWQRQLWSELADLNFCVYWYSQTAQYYDADGNHLGARRGYKGDYSKVHKTKYPFQHHLVGRKVNTAATKAMADYLQSTIERLTRAKMNNDPKEFFTNYAHSYREGLVYRIVEKIHDRRKSMEAEERKRQREAAKNAGVSTATALTIADVRETETKANYDFQHGEGAWDKREADHAKWKAKKSAERAARIKAYNEWATANPEEARKLEEENKEKERKREAAEARRAARSSGPRDNRNYSAFWSGYDKGKDVSIDPQMEKTEQRRLK